MKRKLACLALASAFWVTLAGCSDSAPTGETGAVTPTPTASEVIVETAEIEVQQPEGSDETQELLDQLSVEMEMDQVLSQAIITVTNNSPMTFDGNIYIYFTDESGEIVDDDTLFVEDLAPGNYTYARTDVTSVGPLEMRYRVSDPEFSEGPSAEGGTLDETASASLAEEFEGGFGGAGNPEWATSWYKYVASIEVYTADTNYAVITVTDDADQESIDRIGVAIFANYCDDFGLSRVLVVNASGDTLFDRAA